MSHSKGAPGPALQAGPVGLRKVFPPLSPGLRHVPCCPAVGSPSGGLGAMLPQTPDAPSFIPLRNSPWLPFSSCVTLDSFVTLGLGELLFFCKPERGEPTSQGYLRANEVPNRYRASHRVPAWEMARPLLEADGHSASGKFTWRHCSSGVGGMSWDGCQKGKKKKTGKFSCGDFHAVPPSPALQLQRRTERAEGDSDLTGIMRQVEAGCPVLRPLCLDSQSRAPHITPDGT